MNKTIIGLAAGVVVIGGYVWVKSNEIVTADQRVQYTTGQVQNVLQRQAELIPNLVETVKASSRFEQSTLDAITKARSGLSDVTSAAPGSAISNPALQEKLNEAEHQLGQVLINVRSTVEAYPDLKASGQYTMLMTELSGSINRVAVERRQQQLSIESYNNLVVRFPATLLGHSPKPFFVATAEAQHAPSVNFRGQ